MAIQNNDSPLAKQLLELRSRLLVMIRETVYADRTSRSLSQTTGGATWTTAAKKRDDYVRNLKEMLKTASEEL